VAIERLAHAGMYFPGRFDELMGHVRWMFYNNDGPGSMPDTGRRILAGRRGYLGFVAPHAPLRLALGVYGWAYYYMVVEGVPETVVILGPDHYGRTDRITVGRGFGLASPVATLWTDDRMAEAIVEAVKGRIAIRYGEAELFAREHSIEVHVAILSALIGPDVRIVPIIVPYALKSPIAYLGRAIANAVLELGRDTVILASTDMSHYTGTKYDAEQEDKRAIEVVLRLNWGELLELNARGRLSWCGVGAVAAMLAAARALKATRGKLLAYKLEKTESGFNGYGSIVVYRA